jgi:hypothetical protein
MEEKPKRRWILLQRLVVTLSLVAALYVFSSGPAEFLFQRVHYEENQLLIESIMVVYAPIFAYRESYPDSAMNLNAQWWGDIGSKIRSAEMHEQAMSKAAR